MESTQGGQVLSKLGIHPARAWAGKSLQKLKKAPPWHCDTSSCFFNKSLYGFYSMSRTFELCVILRWNDHRKTPKLARRGTLNTGDLGICTQWSRSTYDQSWGNALGYCGRICRPHLLWLGEGQQQLWLVRQSYAISVLFEDLNLFKFNQDSKTHQNSKATSGLSYFVSLCWGFSNSKNLIFDFSFRRWIWYSGSRSRRGRCLRWISERGVECPPVSSSQKV